jgi:hypothetical protein
MERERIVGKYAGEKKAAVNMLRKKEALFKGFMVWHIPASQPLFPHFEARF